jgi:hypothetical protein
MHERYAYKMPTKYWLENWKRRDHFEHPLYRWKDNIEMDVKEIVCEGVDWM